MRTVLIGAALLSLSTAEAEAQMRAPTRPGAPNVSVLPPRGPIHTLNNGSGGRWGGQIGGRWHGGAQAPGGWQAYRRPVRGVVLPGYWTAPTFAINNWSAYRLAQPPVGYHWSRYYNDAVLIDDRGSVYDSFYSVDWDRYDEDGYDAGGYAGDASASGRYGADYAYPGAYSGASSYPPERRDNGLGGAAIGAVAGGVAGNLIAGRGNRTAGTLIGAGVGGVAGYAVDKAEDRGRRVPPPAPGYGAGYAPPPSGYGAGYSQPRVGDCQPSVVHAGPGTTVVTTSSAGCGGYSGYQGGDFYPGATVTTVTVTTQPVVTTTTTETYEDVVTYSRPARRSAPRRRWTKCRC